MRYSAQLLLDRAPEALIDALVPEGSELRCDFEPQGLSLVRLAASGTAAVHTWPERNRATLDCYGTPATQAEAVLAEQGWTILDTLSEDAWNSSTT